MTRGYTPGPNLNDVMSAARTAAIVNEVRQGVSDPAGKAPSELQGIGHAVVGELSDADVATFVRASGEAQVVFGPVFKRMDEEAAVRGDDK